MHDTQRPRRSAQVRPPLPDGIALDPLPLPLANERLDQVAAWLPPLTRVPSIPLPRPPEPVHLTDEENLLENTARRVGTAASTQMDTIELEDEPEDVEVIELEELEEEEDE
jgi:hypothetical protein